MQPLMELPARKGALSSCQQQQHFLQMLSYRAATVRAWNGFVPGNTHSHRVAEGSTDLQLLTNLPVFI